MSYNSILEAIKTNSEINPGKLCVGDKKNKATYGQFWKMINKGAAYLEKNGVKKGDVVVLRGAQKVEYLFSIFSIQLLGAIACPLEKAVKEEKTAPKKTAAKTATKKAAPKSKKKAE